VPKYVIEREMPQAGDLSAEQLRGAAQTSRAVAAELGPEIQWQESYVTDDKVYCVFISSSEALIREHARRSEFPLNRISRVATMIDPTTAEAPVATAIPA
jgi:hypothetical protein